MEIWKKDARRDPVIAGLEQHSPDIGGKIPPIYAQRMTAGDINNQYLWGKFQIPPSTGSWIRERSQQEDNGSKQ